MCISSSLQSNEEKCFIPHHIRPVWIISFALAIGAVGLLTLSVLLLIASQYVETATVEYGRLTGFVASRWWISIDNKEMINENRFFSDLFVSIDCPFSYGF